MSECIFCKIAAGELDVELVYEDDMVLAFDDRSPQAPVHTLIIPRDHYAHMADNVPADVLGAVFSAVPNVARAKGVLESGFRTIVNTGQAAGQTVHHLHVHVLGGVSMAEGMVPRDFPDS